MRRHYTMKQRFFTKNFYKNALLLLIPIVLIGPYSIYQLGKESKNALKKSNYNVLYQIDETMNTFLSELDNVYYYVRSNPSITASLKVAYNEPVLSNNSLRNINNICSLLRYYTYTNEYIRSIYVYYYNDMNRMLIPEKGMVSGSSCQNAKWIVSAKNSEKDIWMETDVVAKDKYSEPVPVIYYCRKLYSTINPSNLVGVVVMEYNINAISRYIDSLGLYEGQSITIFGGENNLLFQNRPIDVAAILNQQPKLQLGEFEYYDTRRGREKYTVSRMQSNYMKDLEYVSTVPTRNIMGSSSRFATVFFLLIGGAICSAIVLAVVRTRKDYERLDQILNLLSNPELAVSEKNPESGVFTDPYNYITYNIINLFLQQKYLKVQTSEQKYKLEALELSALQHQINPHFLNNTLNTIYWEAIGLTQEPNVCSEMLTKVASIMRYSLSNPSESVTLEEELGYLKSYVYIQTKRYAHKFQVELEVDETALIYSVKKIILQPLVENAMNHGIKEMGGTCVIRIKIHRMREYVYVSVLDNGVGITKEKLQEIRETLDNTEAYSTHVGLINSHRRLILTYGNDAGIHIGSRQHVGTCVFFRLPIDTSYS